MLCMITQIVFAEKIATTKTDRLWVQIQTELNHATERNCTHTCFGMLRTHTNTHNGEMTTGNLIALNPAQAHFCGGHLADGTLDIRV